ncbi:hypothetical protein LJC49_01085 [Ruminococcaceae bacterium OttesenSCG-928-I18]|nr:hypothetical protein [Ruminococcaceae bacterium OttesenSCG-928-I18]
MTADQFVRKYNRAAADIGLIHSVTLQPPEGTSDPQNCDVVASGGGVSFLLSVENGLLYDLTVLAPVGGNVEACLVIFHLVMGIAAGISKKACNGALRRLGFYDSRFLHGTKTRIRGYAAEVRVTTLLDMKHVMFQLLKQRGRSG